MNEYLRLWPPAPPITAPHRFMLVHEPLRVERRGARVVLRGGNCELPLTPKVAAQLVDDVYDALQTIQAERDDT